MRGTDKGRARENCGGGGLMGDMNVERKRGYEERVGRSREERERLKESVGGSGLSETSSIDPEMGGA